jgi:hypothetical protein
MTGYTKLFSTIVTSTIWQEDLPTKVLWITLLALSDSDGMVEGAIPGIARIAGVSLEECERSLAKLQQPDKYSRTPDHDGRRIEVVEGGWFILNRGKYRDKDWQQEKLERHREANRRYYERQRNQNSDHSDNPVSESDRIGDKKEKEKEKETTTTEQSQSSEGASGEPQKQAVSTGAKKKRRAKVDVLSDFSAETSRVVNELLPKWPRSQPKDGSPIRIDLAAVAGRVDQILSNNEEANPELLIKAAKMYLAESKRFYRAPQFFFGPGNGDEPPWVFYARMVVHQTSKAHDEASQ